MNLADKTILNILAKSCGAFLLLVSSIVMARHFPKAEFGTFLQVILVVNTSIMLSYFGLPQSIYYFYHRCSNRCSFLVQSVILSIIIGIIAALVVYKARGIIGSWFNNVELREYGWVASIMVLSLGASRFRDPILISSNKLLLNSAITLFCKILFYTPTIILPFCGYALSVILNLMSIACIIEFSIYLAVVSAIALKENKNLLIADTDGREYLYVTIVDQLKYALPIGASSYMGIVGKQLDQYIISIFFSPSDFAVYSRGAIRLPVVSNFQILINNILMPKYVVSYSERRINKFLEYFHSSIEKVAKVKFPAFAFLFAVAPSLIMLMYTTRYSGAASVLRVYLINLILGVTVYGIIPRAAGNTKYIFYSTVAAISTNAALSFLLIQLLGAIGAAIGTIISSFIMAGYLLAKSCHILEIPFNKILPWQLLFKILSVSLVASLPVYLIQYLVPVHGVKFAGVLLIESCLFVYIYILLMMKFGLISATDLDVASRWLRIDLRVWLPKLTFCSTHKKE